MEVVVQFLLQDCCAGHPELCASLIDSLSGCEAAKSDKKDSL
jgi:hypothetical protein